MIDLFAGGTLDRLPPPRAARSMRFFEYAPRGPLPTLATLARAAKQLPKTTRCALVCPRSTWSTERGPLRPGAELDRGLDWIKRCADILNATAIVLATGAELSPGERDRTLLSQFLEKLRPTGRLLVVAPRGLWEAEHGHDFARKARCLYGLDPLEDEAGDSEVLYARVRPMGARPRLTDGHFLQIAQRLLESRAETAYVAFESAQPLRDAARLRKAVEELGESDLAGFGDEEDEEQGDEDQDDEDQDGEQAEQDPDDDADLDEDLDDEDLDEDDD